MIERLQRRPAVIGHFFGGLLAQMIAGRGLSSASVAIDPAPFRGVLRLPRSALKSSWPVLGNPAIISGERDHVVPRAVAHASFKRQRRNLWDTESVEIPYRGHALTIDNGWREVADTALIFVRRDT